MGGASMTMTPIKIVFQSKECLVVYSADPESFSESILSTKPPEIMRVEYGDIDHLKVHPELQEVKLTLQSGAIMLCKIAKTEMPKAQYIEEIVDCDISNVMAYTELAKQETELDLRFAAASLVINNLPDLDTRLYLHRQYMKRKQAYVSAVEALIDGVIRRPNEND